MRGVRPPSWKNGLPLGRRALVGSREEAVARRTRQTTPAATRAVAVEGDDSVDARGPRLLASRSRPNQQPTLKPEGVLSALPHVARPAGAPAPALVHVVPAQSTRRPGSVSVEAGVTATSLRSMARRRLRSSAATDRSTAPRGGANSSTRSSGPSSSAMFPAGTPIHLPPQSPATMGRPSFSCAISIRAPLPRPAPPPAGSSGSTRPSSSTASRA